MRTSAIVGRVTKNYGHEVVGSPTLSLVRLKAGTTWGSVPAAVRSALALSMVPEVVSSCWGRSVPTVDTLKD